MVEEEEEERSAGVLSKSASAASAVEFVLHTTTPPAYLSYADRSADGPGTGGGLPRPPRGLLWQKSCLVRKNRHSATSPAIASKCDGMLGGDDLAVRESGSLHWSLKVNGMLCEDRCKNCLSVEKDPVTGALKATIRHCKDLMPLVSKGGGNSSGSSRPETPQMLPRTRIVAKTLPLAEVDRGLGPPFVTTVCEFSDGSSSDGVVTKEHEYINDIWPLQARAAYCASHRAECLYNPRAGQCRPRRMVSSMRENWLNAVWSFDAHHFGSIFCSNFC